LPLEAIVSLLPRGRFRLALVVVVLVSPAPVALAAFVALAVVATTFLVVDVSLIFDCCVPSPPEEDHRLPPPSGKAMSCRKGKAGNVCFLLTEQLLGKQVQILRFGESRFSDLASQDLERSLTKTKKELRQAPISSIFMKKTLQPKMF